MSQSRTPTPEPPDPTTLAIAIKTETRRLGFDLVGITPAVAPPGFANLQEWLSRGYSGEMNYIPRREHAYQHPRHVLERVNSVIMLAMNYHTAPPPAVGPTEAAVASYAWGTADYHDVLRKRMRQLTDFLHLQAPGCRTRGVVDTAPLLERDFARLSGLGWFGKNTMLINKHAGSWLFLCAVLTDVTLQHDAPHTSSHCGTCTRCLDACPTDAFPAPYVLDARKCISYLTIEQRNQPIPSELRPDMGHWLFGCDICQDVCPWNRKAPSSSEPAFQPTDGLAPADAVALLNMNNEQFRQRFKGTPLFRSGRAGLLRNAAIVLGNARPPAALPVLIAVLNDEEPLIRGAAAWALGRIGGTRACIAIKARLEVEDDPTVVTELHSALPPE